MDVALIGEGTYPYQFGGVSVWCDQLIRGMPDYNFKVVGLVATGAEQVRWELPDNVASVVALPLWGPAPTVRGSKRRAGTSFRPLVTRLVDILLSPPEEAQAAFGEVLREMFERASRESLSAGLASEEAVQVLSDAWKARRISARWLRDDVGDAQPAPTLHDAVTAMQLLEHSLRPLSYAPVQADVAHAVTNGLGALPALAAKWRYGMPMLVTEHGIYMREQYILNEKGPYRWPVKAFHLAFLRRLCTLGYHEAQTIAPGNVYNRRWEERLGADVSRVRTVYNGVDPADFPAVAGEPDVPTISWAGRVDPIKDLETLLRAFSDVRRELPAARLRLFGSSPQGREAYLERCRHLAGELGIGDAVAFEGRVEDIRDAYAAGHVVVLCSITEGFPYTLIEAMTCGRACVATDVGGVTEAIADTGLVVAPRSSAALAQACLTLLRDDDLRRRLGAAARERALRFFTVDRAISAYDEIYSFLGSGHELPTATYEWDADSDELLPSTSADSEEESDQLLSLEAAG
jgi:glycosyltransferase involved in cell wall biosynthesis